MHNCAFCKNPLKPLSEWKAADGQHYCGEFCADAGESVVFITVPIRSRITAARRP